MDRAAIERECTNLLRSMWQGQERLFDKRLRPLELLEPRLAARLLGLRYETHAGLGRFGDRGVQFEVAGFVDRRARRIAVSQQFPAEVMRFTGAHEIGHWLLHPKEIVHRDRPVKGLDTGDRRRPGHEQEADYFSACFLAPRKLVTQAFVARFGAVPLAIDDAAAFWLSPDDPEALLAPSHGLERALAVATARSYGGKPFESLASLFRVSPTTMAIRVHELRFVTD